MSPNVYFNYISFLVQPFIFLLTRIITSISHLLDFFLMYLTLISSIFHYRNRKLILSNINTLGDVSNLLLFVFFSPEIRSSFLIWEDCSPGLTQVIPRRHPGTSLYLPAKARNSFAFPYFLHNIWLILSLR